MTQLTTGSNVFTDAYPAKPQTSMIATIIGAWRVNTGSDCFICSPPKPLTHTPLMSEVQYGD